MTIRVGIMGAGQAGGRQAYGFARSDSATIVGVADPDSGRAQTLAAEHGATAMTDWRELFSLGLDVLVVATPHSMHLEPALQATERGVHLMMEKPIATTLEDATRIVDVARSAGTALTVSFVHRHREEVRRALNWLAKTGPLQLGRETMSGARTTSNPGWLTNREIAGGGVLMYSAIHGVDRLRWFFADEPVQVSAVTRRYAPDNDQVEDGIAALITFASGAAATLDANAPTYKSAFPIWETEFHGATGMMRIRTREFSEMSSDSGTERYLPETDPEAAHGLYPFQRQAEEFLNSIEQKRDPLVTGEDGIAALRICLAMYESAETGKPVEF